MSLKIKFLLFLFTKFITWIWIDPVHQARGSITMLLSQHLLKLLMWELNFQVKKENSVELTSCPGIDFALELMVCHLLALSGIIMFYNSAAAYRELRSVKRELVEEDCLAKSCNRCITKDFKHSLLGFQLQMFCCSINNTLWHY